MVIETVKVDIPENIGYNELESWNMEVLAYEKSKHDLQGDRSGNDPGRRSFVRTFY